MGSSTSALANIIFGDDLNNANRILEARISDRGMDKIEALVEEVRATIPQPENAEEQISQKR